MEERGNTDFRYKMHRGDIEVLPFTKSERACDMIHFLATGSSDAILLESDGHFALVDCAEDSDNPRGFRALEFRGYEKEVLAYIKKHAASADGKAHLDFILGTHAHSDHLGGFDTLLSDESIIVDRAYLKRYDESRINSFEVEKWDNSEVYEQTVEALRARNIPIVCDIEQPHFRLGNMDITLLNTEYDTLHTDIGENDNSIGMLIEVYKKRVFLAADIDNETGDEDRLAPIIGKVDLLKVGHHSYDGSSTDGFLKALMPAVCVVTNNYESSDKSTLDKIKNICNSNILVTGAERGVITAFYPEGSLKYFNNIM